MSLRDAFMRSYNNHNFMRHNCIIFLCLKCVHLIKKTYFYYNSNNNNDDDDDKRSQGMLS